jgi:AraC-like DNA-binding protein
MINQEVMSAAQNLDTATDLEKFFEKHLCMMSVGLPTRISKCLTHSQDIHVGNIVINKYDCRGNRFGRRRPDQIREDHSDYYLVLVPHSGTTGLSQNGRDVKIPQGSFCFLTARRPFFASRIGIGESESFSDVFVRIPGPLLRERVPYIDEGCAVPVAFRPGASHIMKTLFDAALEDGRYLSDTQAKLFSVSVVDAVANAALGAKELDGLRETLSQPAHERVFNCARDFIISRLSDPDLRVMMVAEHCHVSVRRLQAAFAKQSESVELFITENRLQRCRAALRNPNLKYQPISDLAANWGFKDASHFSHAYNRRFGLAPSRDRG